MRRAALCLFELNWLRPPHPTLRERPEGHPGEEGYRSRTLYLIDYSTSDYQAMKLSIEKHDRFNKLLLFIIAFAVAIGIRFWPGGYDALHFYLRSPFPGTTAPGWVYLLTYPLSRLGWPLSWQILTFLNVWSVGILAQMYQSNRPWWNVFLSLPFLWTIWLGQIEFFPIFGLIIFLLVYRKRLPFSFLGISWLALLTKPQVGLGILIYQVYWLLHQDRPLYILAEVLFGAISISIFSIILWPQWPKYWVDTLVEFRATWWNASIWPYGLLTLPFSLYIFPRVGPTARLRFIAAQTLLVSPYFALYHCTMLIALSNDWPTILLSWLPLLIGYGVPHQWMKWGWILPLWVWARELINVYMAWKLDTKK